MGFFFTGIAILIVPETYEPVLLEWRAKKIRHKTRNWAIHAKSEESDVNIKIIAEKYLLRPFQMLALEPILLLVTLYMGFIYGFLYMCFNAYPISFQELRGWNEGIGALPFLAIVAGVIAASVFVVIFSKTRLQRQTEKLGYIVPEERLIPMMVGGLGALCHHPYENSPVDTIIALPAGMFWFGWTSSPHITWVPQVISGGLLGAGILLIFLQVRESY